MGKHQCTACKRTFRTAQGLGLHFNHARKNPKVCDGQPRIDPRDAEIARLRADKAAYDQGRADERAAIVRWLRRMGTGDPFVAALTNGIEAGEHER